MTMRDPEIPWKGWPLETYTGVNPGAVISYLCNFGQVPLCL